MCEWQVNLLDPLLMHTIPERFRDENHTHYKALCTGPAYFSLLYNNNNNQDDIYGAVVMAKPLREFTRFI